MIIKLTKFVLILTALMAVTTSCLDNKVEEYEAEAKSKHENYKNQNGFTEEHHIVNGIYLKFEGDVDPTAPTGETGNTINLSYTGKYTNGEEFETTDIERSAGIPYNEVFIYGPKRLKLGSLIVGMDTALKLMPAGSKAEILIPHEYAYGDYEPVVYEVEMHDIITSDSLYESNLFAKFREDNNFEHTISNGLYYKFTDGDTLRSSIAVRGGDTIGISLVSRYAEDYYDDNTGRIFYPRMHESDTFYYFYGATTVYPIIPAIDSAVKYMEVGETIEIAFESGAEASSGYAWGYGEYGYTDPNFNFALVSHSTPLHYTIQLLFSQREQPVEEED